MSLPECPVCLVLLEVPVTLPCSHELCLECYQSSLDSANFYCPLCRKRFSSWSRNVSDPVNSRRLKELEATYRSMGPIESLRLAATLREGEEERREGSGSCCCSEEGEISNEYTLAVEKYQLEREELEAEDREVSFRLQVEEEELATEMRRQLKEDETLAREMMQKDQEALNIEISDQVEADRQLALELEKELRKEKKAPKSTKQEVTLYKWFSVVPKK